jgi:hypothetical protein
LIKFWTWKIRNCRNWQTESGWSAGVRDAHVGGLVHGVEVGEGTECGIGHKILKEKKGNWLDQPTHSILKGHK